MDKTRLSQLKNGEYGYVEAVSVENEKLKHRLIDMGITTGVRICLKKAAPSGDPLEVRLRGYTLTLRRSDADNIYLVAKNKEAEFLERRRQEKTHLSMQAQSKAAEEHTDSDNQEISQRAVRLTNFVISSFSEHKDGNGKSCASGAFCSAERSFTGQCECPDKSEDMSEDEALKIALAGNPNSGKTTLFNVLTGSKEHVGNWPGVTVEKKEGKIQTSGRGQKYCTHGHDMTLVDLPGIYSLSPHTMEELVARRFLTEDKPDAIINIVDATNLERNLYLTLQLLELDIPMLVALNMIDEVEKRGDSIDCKSLSSSLGVPVVPISARSGSGINELVESAQMLLHVAHLQHHSGDNPEPDVFYDSFTHALHHELGSIVDPYVKKAGLPLHFAEIKLLEKDEDIIKKLNMPEAVKQRAFEVVDSYAENSCMGDPEVAIADSRYTYIEKAVGTALKRNDKYKDDFEDMYCDTSDSNAAEVLTANEASGAKSARGTAKKRFNPDNIITHKVLALPIFICIMLLIFVLTFSTAGAYLSDAVGNLIALVTPLIEDGLLKINTAPWLVSLICDGIIAGVGGVLTFLPQIAILFTLLSALEDSGYMARIAFIMDSTMRKIGLSGKAIIPLLMGFGCTVPAAMGARTMENIKNKRMTILLLPFMSCSAKLPIYAMLAGAFFGKGNLLVILGLYLFGILCAVLMGVIFKSTLFKASDAQFLIELPPYRWPSLRNTMTHVWERVKHFLVKAGTLILLMSVALYFLLNFDFSLTMVDNQSMSILGKIGEFIAPIFIPTGFPFWQAVVALFAGLMAKEAVVSALALFYGFAATASSGIIHTALSVDFTAASALSFLTFVLLYTPCVAALSTLSSELQSRKWAAFAALFQVAFAYVASTVVYFVANLII